MTKPSERIRKTTTFLLAVFLWVHALSFLNIQSALISKFTHLLRLTVPEVVLFGLLLLFSFLAASGFWKSLLSLVYIYFFPFVLLAYLLYWCFAIVRAINRWFVDQAPIEARGPLVAEQTLTTALGVPAKPGIHLDTKRKFVEALRFLLRPFRRFMALWCILLLVTTHIAIVWLCLVVVLIHLARRIFVIVKVLLFSDPWLKQMGAKLPTGLNNALAGLAAVTPDAAPTDELKALWNQLNFWKRILEYLNDPYLLSRWAWFLGTVFLGSVYIYIAILFSFAYYGMDRVSGASYSWPDALVTSLFIPFFVSELPKITTIRILGGLQCVLVVGIGVGTIVKFLRRKLDAIRKAAAELNDRFTDHTVREKYVILEAKFSTTPTQVPGTGNINK